MTTLTFGPPLGVRNTTEPYDDAALGDYLQNAVNCYFRDPTLLSGAQARPGATKTFSLTGPGQGGCVVVDVSSTYQLIVANGKVYRLANDLSSATDVTPVGVVISTTLRVHMVPTTGGKVIVSDLINQPWIGTNLGGTPITATHIDADGSGTFWCAGRPTVYQDSMVFPVFTPPSGSAVISGGLLWSEPNQPATGYVQSGYANFFNAIEQSALGITAVWGTNNGLVYWRQQGIGVLLGSLYSFSTTATRDAKSAEVGTNDGNTIEQIGNNIFFTDIKGRPWMMPINGTPQPIWKQMSAIISAQTSASMNVFDGASTAVVVPELNAYAVVPWGSVLGGTRSTSAYLFDGLSGNYLGEWKFSSSSSQFVGINHLMQVSRTASSASPYLALLGGANGANGADLYYMSQLNDGHWADTPSADVVPSISVTTPRMGYSEDLVMTAGDTASIVAMSAAPLTVTVQTPYTSSTTEATALSPNGSQDGAYRAVIGMDVSAARGLTFTVAPTTAGSQWGFQRVKVPVVMSKAGPEDQ